MRTYKRVRLGERKGAILLGGQKFTGQAGNPLLNNLSKAEIERSLTEFMSGDSKFNNAIRKHLFQRLKYATGNLLNSLKWKAKVSIDGIGNDFSVSVGVYLTILIVDAVVWQNEEHGRVKFRCGKLVSYIHQEKYYLQSLEINIFCNVRFAKKVYGLKKTKPFQQTRCIQ